jgi:hypothetical protein
MFAWCAAVQVAKVNLETEAPPLSRLISQPPHDGSQGRAAIYHYTWGTVVKDLTGKEVWKFDKREYTAEAHAWKPPRLPMPPPWAAGMKLQDGLIVTQELHRTLSHMVGAMNDAVDTLPDLTPTARQ